MERSHPQWGQTPASTPLPRTRFQIPLTIRTAEKLTLPAAGQQQRQGLSSSQLHPPYPVYPLSIPPEKQAKARKLYRQYIFQEGLAHKKLEPLSATSYHNEPFLNVPGPAAPRSVTSQASSRHKRAVSISTSNYDAITDLSSVLSFDGCKSPSEAQGDLMSVYDGKPVKTRTRQKLSDVKRAKAALMRHLGSCWPCRSRKVPCPLRHHDVDSLAQSTLQGHRSRSQNQSLSSLPTSSQHTPVQEQPPASSNISQNHDLAGIGGNSQVLEELGPISTTLDIQSPGGAYGSTHTQMTDTLSLDLVGSAQGEYQDADMFFIGVQRDIRYYCQHANDVCNQNFATQDELEDHFATSHFAYTRTKPAHCHICSKCNKAQGNPFNLLCEHCGIGSSIELWIYGHTIRPPSFQRYTPDGQDFQSFMSSSQAPLYTASSFNFSDMNWDLDMGNTGLDGNFNADSFDMGGNMYGDPGGYSYDPSASDVGGNQFQGNADNIFGAPQMSADIQGGFAMQSFKLRRNISPHNNTLLVSLLLLLLVFGSVKARTKFLEASNIVHAHLPVISFLSIAASIAVSISVKHYFVHRLRRSQHIRSPFDILKQRSMSHKHVSLPLSSYVCAQRIP